MAIHNNTTLKAMIYNGLQVKKWRHNDVEVFSAGNIVTYHIDTNIAFAMEVESGASCLSPDYTPKKTGWTFIGWREDRTPTNSVLTEKIMGSEPIVLYAVFEQTITLSYNGNNATSGEVNSQTGKRYYNTGNCLNPSFTLASNAYAKTGWTWQAWAWGSERGAKRTAGDTVTLAFNTVFYAIWSGITTEVFNAGDNSLYMWRRKETVNNGWGLATPCYNYDVDTVQTFNNIDCTHYNHCIVRIKGVITSDPSGGTVNNTSVRIGFTTDYTQAIEKVNDEYLINKWNNGSGGSGTEGLAYDTWYDLIIDISALTGIQDLNVFIGGAYTNSGYVFCSKITLTNELGNEIYESI